MKRYLPIAAVLAGLALPACGGADDATTEPAPREAVETPPPSAAGQLPPEFLECMADQGFAISSPDEVHSAPQQVLQACFGVLHQGGASP
jgi:hypothetical protein